jgi:hypothetical protein
VGERHQPVNELTGLYRLDEVGCCSEFMDQPGVLLSFQQDEYGNRCERGMLLHLLQQTDPTRATRLEINNRDRWGMVQHETNCISGIGCRRYGNSLREAVLELLPQPAIVSYGEDRDVLAVQLGLTRPLSARRGGSFPRRP